MTFRERILNIFQRKPVDNIVYQPRMEYWFNRNRELGILASPYREMELLEFFDEMGCSLRPYGHYGECLERQDPRGVKREILVFGANGAGPMELAAQQRDLLWTRAQFTSDVFPPGSKRVERCITPVGTLETCMSCTDLSYRVDKHPVRTPEDMRVQKYILEGTTYRFNLDRFREVDALIGPRSAPMLMMPRVNIQRLSVEWMGFQNLVYALHDQPDVIEDLIRTTDETDERIIDAIVECPVTIVSFDDNIDQHLCPPTLFRRYVLPVYQHRVQRLRAAGKTCHAHWDGHCRLLLPLAGETGLDGIEALTPQPQGDMTIEEIKATLGEEMILLDGIPMTWFLPHEKDEDLERVTRQIIETFAPNLILGISDEPSPPCRLEKIRRVGEIVREYEGRVMELAKRRQERAPSQTFPGKGG